MLSPDLFPLLQHSSDTFEAEKLKFKSSGLLKLMSPASNGPFWTSRTDSSIGTPFVARLAFNDDGRLVMWSTHGSIIWSANVLGKEVVVVVVVVVVVMVEYVDTQLQPSSMKLYLDGL